MINYQRPLVIYEKMEVEFTRLDLIFPEIEFASATFDVDGIRGLVTLNFAFKEEGQVVGKGLKRMVASGLKPNDQAEIDDPSTVSMSAKKPSLARLSKRHNSQSICQT